MLGDRYGWVPPMSELAKNRELSSQYPWLERAIQEGRSATEMEFLHGFLNGGSERTHPLVYFRNPREESDPRVIRLKEEVSNRLGSIPTFDTPQEFGTLLERDLLLQIEQFWPAAQQASWLDEERAGHAAFAQSRRKGYVANPALSAALDSHLGSAESMIVLTGESGSGKSSLLAHWAESIREKPQGERKLFTIEHFVGVTAASTDPDILVRRIIEEIRERIHSEDPVPQSSTELVQELPSWLGRISSEPLVILVDAINQFNTDGRFLRWLPDYASPNLKWIISSTSGEALDRLRARGEAIGQHWREVPVNPITVSERELVLRTFLAGYQKKLDRKLEARIVQDQKSSNPLFLRTLLEELRLQGKHEELGQIVDHYLSSADIPDLFKRILERLEHDYGSSAVRAFLVRIWAAPHGLSESEVLASTQLDRASLSQLLHAFDYHLVRLKGRLSFFHDHLRMGVEARYLDTQGLKEEAWRELASYFETTDPSVTKALSLPWLWRRAERWPELRTSILDVALLPFLTDGSRSYELLGYWLALEKQAEAAATGESAPNASDSARVGWNIDVVGEYEAALRSRPLDLPAEREVRYRLGLFFRNAGWHRGATDSAERALELCENVTEETHELRELKIKIALELGKAYLDRTDLPNAADALEKALHLLGDDLASKRGDDLHFSLTHLNVRNEYTRLLKDQGKYKAAEGVSRMTLDAAVKHFGENHSAAQNEIRLLADILSLDGNYPEAEALHRRALKSIEASLGPESLEAGYYLNQLADFIRRFGEDYDEAERLFDRATSIIQNRLGDHHPDLAILLHNFGTLYAQRGRWAEAERLFQRSLTICDAVFGTDHAMTAHCVNSYASSLYWQRDYGRAEPLNRRALAVRRSLLGDHHPETAVAYNNLGNTLRRLENFDEAEGCYQAALDIRMKTIGPNHEDTARTQAAYGALLHITGNFEKSEVLLSEAFEVRKAIRGIGHNDTLSAAVELAEVLLEESKQERVAKLVDEIAAGAGSEDTLPEALRTRFRAITEKLQVTG